MHHISGGEDVERRAILDLFRQVCSPTETKNDFDAALSGEFLRELRERVSEVSRSSYDDLAFL